MLNYYNSFASRVFSHIRFFKKTYITYSILIAFLFFAVALRLNIIVIRGGLYADQFDWAMDNYLGGLTRNYLQIRDFILSGEQEKKLFIYLPGYSAILAIIDIFISDTLIYVRVVQSIIDSIVIIPLFYVAHKITRSAPLALISSGLYATAPWWAAGSTYLLAESLLPALVICLLAALVAIRERPGKLHHWIALGLFGAVLPFFRSDMLLIFIPLAIWAIMVAPARRRLLSVFGVLIAFASPLFAWIIRNYIVHGYFLLTPPVKWYAAWSGLGQIENTFGYSVSDKIASEILNSNGMRFGSPQAENYWRSEYISAWLEHPEHVLQTIFFRVQRILLKFDFKIVELTDILFLTIMYATPFALLWLLWRRRWTDALLVALPAGYALCSLGILYVEQRYVRYASLTYALAFPVLLAASADLPSRFARDWSEKRRSQARLTLAVAAMIGLIIHAAVQYGALRSKAMREVYSQRLDLGTTQALPWSQGLDELSFVKAMPDVEISKSGTGLALSAEARDGLYLATAPLESGQSEAVTVRYRVRLDEAGLGMGVLSADNQRWLSYSYLTGAPGSVIEGEFTTMVEPGSSLVITAEDGEGRYRALIQGIKWKGGCVSEAKPEPLGLLFNKDLIAMGPCAAN